MKWAGGGGVFHPAYVRLTGVLLLGTFIVRAEDLSQICSDFSSIGHFATVIIVIIDLFCVNLPVVMTTINQHVVTHLTLRCQVGGTSGNAHPAIHHLCPNCWQPVSQLLLGSLSTCSRYQVQRANKYQVF